jgi:uncharacterized protein (TIGR00730 family)
MNLKKVCVYCASSTQCNPIYHEAAFELGKILAKNSITIVYGGGAVGSMGHLANGALSENGEVIGIIPKFMFDLEWGHSKISDLQVVENMHIRKQKMIENTDAVIALPGGCGTFEELFEALTMKRLGLYPNPIVLLNTQGFYDKFVNMMTHSIDEKFMDERHRLMWTIAKEPEEVVPSINSTPAWFENARSFAAI